MLNIYIKHHVNRHLIQLNIHTEKPKIYAIAGVSGVGKTTLLNMIAGLRTPEEGRIQIGSRTLLDTQKKLMLPTQKRKVGYLFQDYQLFPHMTVLQNIEFMHPEKAHVAKLCDALKIEHLKHVYPNRCSGGERQRVALARALSQKPDLLLLDEPFSSLDDDTKEESMALIQSIYAEWQIPIIFVTHSKYEATQLAHETIHIQVTESEIL